MTGSAETPSGVRLQLAPIDQWQPCDAAESARLDALPYHVPSLNTLAWLESVQVPFSPAVVRHLPEVLRSAAFDDLCADPQTEGLLSQAIQAALRERHSA